jgi:hypothetical protein
MWTRFAAFGWSLFAVLPRSSCWKPLMKSFNAIKQKL